MKVSELLTDASKWCQGGFATDTAGKARLAVDPNAVSWCLKGGLRKCYPDAHEMCSAERRLIRAIEKRAPNYGCIADWQDSPGRTFAEIREVILEAGI